MNKEVSSLQRYIWLDQKLNPDSPKYNIGGYAIFNGAIDPDVFKEAFRQLKAGNDIFSFHFKEADGTPVYEIRKELAAEDNLSCFEEPVRQKTLARIQADFSVPFDMAAEPALCKSWLIRESDHVYVWYIKLHHIQIDGYAFHLLFNELSSRYVALAEGSPGGSDSLRRYPYEEFIVSDLAYKQSETFEEDKEFWLSKYRGALMPIYTHSNAGRKHYHQVFFLEEEHKGELDRLAEKNRVTIFHLLLAALAVVTAKYYRRETISIGTPVLNRRNAVQKRTLGAFINVIPLQFDLAPGNSMAQLLGEIKKEVYACYKHQRFQQADILRFVGDKNLERLYDIRLSYENFTYDSAFAGFGATIAALANDGEDDPLSIHIFDYQDGRLKFRIDVNGEFVPDLEAAQLMASYRYLLENLAPFEDKQLTDIGISSQEQTREVLEYSVGTVAERPAATFLALWQRSVAQRGAAAALVSGGQAFTYAEVDALSGRLADGLCKHGVKKGDRVAVALPRSEKSIIAILGVFRLGAVYVPVDHRYPTERKNYLCRDSNCALVLAAVPDYQSFTGGVDFEACLLAGEAAPASVALTGEDEAYVIYTSGTTGTPKGVRISHGSLLDYACTFSEYFSLRDTDVVLQQASLSFDTSVEEIFPVLAAGGQLVIASDPQDFGLLLRECEAYGVTLLSTNPFVVQYLNRYHLDYQLQLRVLISGGDVLRAEYVTNLWHTCAVYNTFGPTESTVCATYHRLRNANAPVPIGKPIANRKAYVLDGRHLLPKGATGEIGLAGKGLALEYLNRPAETAAAFTTVNGERVYRTGDLGKWDEKGNLLFLGRQDEQLSYRGYRIEPQEIERAIMRLDERIHDCFVCVKEIGHQPTLVAYYTVPGDALPEEASARALADQLPGYMIPSRCVALRELPKHTNGKIDRGQLPLPEGTAGGRQATALPRTAQEKEVADLWKKLLRLEEVDVETSFFEMGGHSLLANQFVNIVRENKKKEISLRDFYRAPTIRQLARLLAADAPGIVRIEQAPALGLFPLSYPQESLWFLQQLDRDSTAYYAPKAVRVRGGISIDLVEKVFTRLVHKHEILRTVFTVVEGVPYQQVLDPYNFGVSRISLTQLPAGEQPAAVLENIIRLGNQPFDLEGGPLLRVAALSLSEQETVLVLCLHHLIYDGWTQGVLLEEFIETYLQLRQNPSLPLQACPIQYKDYAYWQKKHLHGTVLDGQLGYWEEKLAGLNPELALPLDYNRPLESSGKGSLITKVLPVDFFRALQTFSEKHNLTVFVVMLTAYKVLLSKFSNEHDVCVGTAVANRRLKELEGMLGMVVNTLALRTQFSDDDSLTEVLGKVKETCFGAYAHEDAPFGKVVEKLKPERTPGLLPLFQHMVSYVNIPSRELELPGLELEVLASHNQSAKCDISLTIFTPSERVPERARAAADEEFRLEWEYSTDIFRSETMERMLAMYVTILQEMVADPHQVLARLNYIPLQEQEQLLEGFNQTQADYPKEKTVVDLFEEQVGRTPQAAALVSGPLTLTYGQLDGLSNQLAHYLFSRYRLDKGEVVGVELVRSHWLIVTILAVLKLRAVYMPLDVKFPVERRNSLRKNSGCRHTIDESVIRDFLTDAAAYHSDFPKRDGSRADWVYVLYTSGSTGTPKGVIGNNTNVISRVTAQNYVHFNTGDVLLSTGAVSFDAVIFEYWGMLLNGGTLVLCSEETLMDVQLLKTEIHRTATNMMWITSGWLTQLVEEDISLFAPLRYLIAGGDVLSPPAIRKLLAAYPGLTLVNGYGPTENTTFSVCHLIQEAGEGSIPIGRPINHSQVYILDEKQMLVPKGVVGEIYLGGAGLSVGYLNQPELTQEKFIVNGYTHQRNYRTGDMGYWSENGTVWFLGRKDLQVKVRGNRVELSEIEAALCQLDPVREAAVVFTSVTGTSDKELIAFLVCSRSVLPAQLKGQLREKLPQYMIPSRFVLVDAMPLASTGKIDRKKLLEYDFTKIAGGTITKRPETNTEKQLAVIWKNLLSLEDVDLHGEFFSLGGNSLNVVRLVNQCRTRFGVRLQFQDVFSHPVLEELAGFIDSLEKSGPVRLQPAPVADLYPLSEMQKQVWLACRATTDTRLFQIEEVLYCRGSLQTENFRAAVRALVSRHEMLRTVFVSDAEGMPAQKVIPWEECAGAAGYVAFAQAGGEVPDPAAFLQSLFPEPFDLARGPLLRIAVLLRNDDAFAVYFTIHHIISDAWSLKVLTAELIGHYQALEAGRPVNLPPLEVHYKDYAVWLAAFMDSPAGLAQKAYWLSQFETLPKPLDLPYARVRPALRTTAGEVVRVTLEGDGAAVIRELSTAGKTTLFATVLAAIRTLLYLDSNNRDFAVGTTVLGREHQQLEGQIGLYASSLPLRQVVKPDQSFASLMAAEHRQISAAMENPYFSPDHLLDALTPPPAGNRAPLFDVTVNFLESAPAAGSPNPGGIRITGQHPLKPSSKYDLNFYVLNGERTIEVALVYNTDLFAPQDMEALLARLKKLLQLVASTPQLPLRELGPLTGRGPHDLAKEQTASMLTARLSEDF